MSAHPNVLKQELHIAVSVEQKRLWGHTTLEISIPASSTSIGLNAFELGVQRVDVDDKDASFDLRPYVAEELPESVLRTCGHASTSEAAAEVAEHSYHEYERMLQREEEPELVIYLPARDLVPSLASTMGQELRHIHVTVHYEVEDPSCGMRFCEGFAYTDNQVRRARAWMPCVDTPNAASPFELHIRVCGRLGFADKAAAVAVGELVGLPSAVSVNDPGRTGDAEEETQSKTWHYSLTVPTPPCHVGFVVGCFEDVQVAPNSSETTQQASSLLALGSPQPLPTIQESEASADAVALSFYAPALDDVQNSATAADVQYTSQFVPLIIALYESHLGCRFPYQSLRQVYVPAGGGPSAVLSFAGLQIISSAALFSERDVEQAIEGRLQLAASIARQWFGVFMRPKKVADMWLVQGMEGHLENLFVKTYMGGREFVYRKVKEREAIYDLDDGNTTPLLHDGPYPWGRLHATETLSPSPLLQLKACAVMLMLERRGSEDVFLKLLTRLLSKATTNAHARQLDSAEFLVELGKALGIRKDIEAFKQRWISGHGCPRITAAFTYNKKRGALDVAIRQSGPECVLRSAQRALIAHAASSLSTIDVQVKERAELTQHSVNLWLEPTTLLEVRLSTKVPKALPKRKKGDGEGDEGGGEPNAADDGGDVTRPPVRWVRLDPGADLLAATHVFQPVWMWTDMLEHAGSMDAKMAAVQALANPKTASYQSVNALLACLNSPETFCRVRVDAASALAASAGPETNFSAVDHLIKFYRDRNFDSASQRPKPHFYADLAEHLVNQAVAVALAGIRDTEGFTPPDITDLLLDILKHNDNGRNPYSDAEFLAAVLEAAGKLRPASGQAMRKLVKQLERYLGRDEVVTSPRHIASRAVLTSLTSLTVTNRTSPPVMPGLLARLERYAIRSQDPALRRTAVACIAFAYASIGGFHAALHAVLDCVDRERYPAVRAEYLDDFQALLQATPSLLKSALAKPVKSQPNPSVALKEEAGPPGEATVEHGDVTTGGMTASLRRLHDLMAASGCPRLRHGAFMLLQTLCGTPPTLFREHDDEELPAIGRAESANTTLRGSQLPATSGAFPTASGLSGKSGRTLARGVAEPSGIKVRLKHSMRPGVSEGPMLSEVSGEEVTRPEASHNQPPDDITSSQPGGGQTSDAPKAGGLTVADIMRQIREGNLGTAQAKAPSHDREPEPDFSFATPPVDPLLTPPTDLMPKSTPSVAAAPTQPPSASAQLPAASAQVPARAPRQLGNGGKITALPAMGVDQGPAIKRRKHESADCRGTVSKTPKAEQLPAAAPEARKIKLKVGGSATAGRAAASSGGDFGGKTNGGQGFSGARGPSQTPEEPYAGAASQAASSLGPANPKANPTANPTEGTRTQEKGHKRQRESMDSSAAQAAKPKTTKRPPSPAPRDVSSQDEREALLRDVIAIASQPPPERKPKKARKSASPLPEPAAATPSQRSTPQPLISFEDMSPNDSQGDAAPRPTAAAREPKAKKVKKEKGAHESSQREGLGRVRLKGMPTTGGKPPTGRAQEKPARQPQEEPLQPQKVGKIALKQRSQKGSEGGQVKPVELPGEQQGKSDAVKPKMSGLGKIKLSIKRKPS